MTEAAALAPARRGVFADRLVLAVFGSTLFLSALLLFALQPLFAKMVLPRLGGTPAVWSVAMVFFQAMLLAGYLYAHLIVRYAGLLGALIIHVAVIGGATLWLPIAIAAGFDLPPNAGLPLWLLAAFAASVGAPFFAVAANAPLLQAWFSQTRHPHSADPYFLYGASNIGSFAALLSYPIVFEPLLSLGAQSRLWTAGYLLLAIAVAGCWMAAWSRRSRGVAVVGPPTCRIEVDWRTRAGWIGWAFVPSAFLVALTAHLSTNIAAAPFLWVVPLAVFLLTFMLAFQRDPLIPRRTMQLILPVAVVGAALTMIGVGAIGMVGAIAVNIFALFVVCMAWHAELFARRPATTHLTEFYLFMSIGGVLGGAFTSLAAPVLFDTVLEFPLLLVAALWAMPEFRAMAGRPIGAVAAGLVLLPVVAVHFGSAVEYQDRSFFGVLATKSVKKNDDRFRLLMHGTTLHGAQRVSETVGSASGRPEPLTYYGAGGPMAEGIGIARGTSPEGGIAVGVVGLGTGSLACHSQPRDSWRFYEIDPSVVRIARNPEWFTFLHVCAPDAAIVQGDARLTLHSEPSATFDVLVLDAFSSDAIPVHLMTREALHLYTQKLRPGGVLLMHISNRYMELESVVSSTAAAEGLSAAALAHIPPVEQQKRFHTPSHVVALSADSAGLRPYLARGWKQLSPQAGRPVAPWTDDYANILAAILRMQGLM